MRDSAVIPTRLLRHGAAPGLFSQAGRRDGRSDGGGILLVVAQAIVDRISRTARPAVGKRAMKPDLSEYNQGLPPSFSVPLGGNNGCLRFRVLLSWFRDQRVWTVLLAVSLAAVFVVAPRAQSTVGDSSEGAATLRPRSVAVVPFANISAESGDDWIGAGIAETLTADLEQFAGLLIIGREGLLDRNETQPERSLPDEAAARERARELGVAWLVTGGYQRLGDQLRITARIVNVETGAAKKTVKIDGEFSEIFALQDRIAAELSNGFTSIAAATAVRPETGERPERRSPLGEGGGPRVSPPALGSGPRGGGLGGRAPTRAPAGRSPVPEGVVAPSLGRPGAGPPARTESDELAGLATEDVSGGIVIGASQPGLGVASSAGALTGRVTVRPAPTDTPPLVDGRLDDAVWRNAARITDFVQMEPLDGVPATEDTEVYLAYDSSNIYLGFYAHYLDPAMMRANRIDRDQADRGDDLFTVYFDTFLDQQRAYVFSVNGYGVQGDSILGSRSAGGGFSGGSRGRRGGGGPSTFTGAPRGDRSWNALFSSGGQLVEDGFTAEMAIPFKSLRYPQRADNTPHQWGLQIVRRIRGKDETDVWSPVSRDVAGFLPQMGVLSGMTGLSTSRNIEILPTFTTFQFGSINDSTGKFETKDPSPEGGLNFKYGLTSNLTADLTYNPDFSQIESDRPQVEINRRFALFFPELRPFFLEGAEIFRVRAPVTLVHTRTIVDPRYGAKLTGKAGRVTVGVMYANDEAAGGLDDPLDPRFEQSAQTFVGRVRYDLYSESFLGAIFTDRELLDSHSRVAGLDSNFRLGATHSFGFSALGTQHRDLDGFETNGYLLDANLSKTGRNLSYSVNSYVLSPDFQTDVGFVRRTDQRQTTGTVSYRWWPESWLINWGPQFAYGRSYNFDGILEDENLQAGVNFSFSNSIRFRIDRTRDMERFGGVDFYKSRYNMFGFVNTSSVLSIGGGFNWGDQVYFDRTSPFLGRDIGLRTFITFRPVSRFQSEVNITTRRFTDPLNLFDPVLNIGERSEDGLIFDVKIFRTLSTYQFTDRFLFRNISEYNTLDKALGLNFLLTYRVNSGTALFVGYDDHYQQGLRYDEELFPTARFQQTNRAIFTKIRYLFRR